MKILSTRFHCTHPHKTRLCLWAFPTDSNRHFRWLVYRQKVWRHRCIVCSEIFPNQVRSGPNFPCCTQQGNLTASAARISSLHCACYSSTCTIKTVRNGERLQTFSGWPTKHTYETTQIALYFVTRQCCQTAARFNCDIKDTNFLPRECGKILCASCGTRIQCNMHT